MFLQPMKKEDISPMTLMSMWNQVRNAATQGVQGGFAKVGETIQKTPLLKLGVNVLNAADYGLGTVAKTTEGLLTDRMNTLRNLKYQPGEGIKSYAQRNVSDITPYVSEKVAGTQMGQRMPLLAPMLGLGAGMISPSPSDFLKVGKVATQAGDVAKFSDEATDLVKPSMLEINPEWTTVYRGQSTNKLNMNEKSAGIGKSFTTDKKIAEVYGNKGKIIDGVVDNKDILRYNELDSNTKKYIKSIIDERIDDVKIGLENENIKPFEELVIELGEIAKIKNKKAIDINSFGIPSESEIRILSEDAIKKIKPKLDLITSEAKKYKSAEDFVKAQPKLYHGTDSKTLENIKSKGFKSGSEGYVSLTDDPKIAQQFAEGRAKAMGGNPVVVEVDPKSTNITRNFDPNDLESIRTQEREFIVKPEDAKNLKIFDKSQLTDIWNKANQSNDLISEARKYKSAEEFVNNLKPAVEDDLSDTKIVDKYKSEAKKGKIRPILLADDDLTRVLDGNHALKAYQELGIVPPIYTGDAIRFLQESPKAGELKWIKENATQLTDIWNKAQGN